MNDDMTKEKKDEIAQAKIRDFKDGNPAPIRAQMEWEEHLIKLQHKLNRRTVLISVILSSLLGMFGVVSGVILKDHLEKNRPQIQQESPQHKGIDKTETVPQTKQGAASTINESSSYKPPNEKNRKR